MVSVLLFETLVQFAAHRGREVCCEEHRAGGGVDEGGLVCDFQGDGVNMGVPDVEVGIVGVLMSVFGSGGVARG